MTTNVEEYLHPTDIRDMHVLTRVLDRKIPESDVYDVPFMPIRPFNGRRVKLKIKEFNGAGLATFKADNANTPIMPSGGDLQDVYLELVTIAEKGVLKESDLIELNSPDNAVAAAAARSMLDIGVGLRRRNINRTRWMAWQAVKDSLTITYPDGAAITVDWDLDADDWNDWMSGSHNPSPAQDWNHQDANDRYDTDILTDTYNWTKLIADDLGVAQSQCIMHLNSDTWRIVRRNKYLLEELGVMGGSDVDRRRPANVAEAADVLDIAEVRIVNAFYLSQSNSRTKNKFLDDGEVLFTSPYIFNGVPIAEMYDGLVARVSGNDIAVATNPGMIAEMYLNAEQAAQNMRVKTARMPIINYPAAFVFSTVWS